MLLQTVRWLWFEDQRKLFTVVMIRPRFNTHDFVHVFDGSGCFWPWRQRGIGQRLAAQKWEKSVEELGETCSLRPEDTLEFYRTWPQELRRRSCLQAGGHGLPQQCCKLTT